jgi:hypothetical protein
MFFCHWCSGYLNMDMDDFAIVFVIGAADDFTIVLEGERQDRH